MSTADPFIWGTDFTPAIDSLIRPDGWQQAARLIKGDSFTPLRVRLDSPVIKSLAVIVDVTGRTIQTDDGYDAVRCRVTFPGDGEPDTVCGGWIYRVGQFRAT